MAPHIHTKDDETRHPPDEALAMLQADHHTIRYLVQHYEDTHDQALQRRIAADVFTALERRTYLEDTTLYAVFAVATDAAGEMLLGDAFRAHQLCTLLMEDLCELAPNDARFARDGTHSGTRASSIWPKKNGSSFPRRHGSWRQRWRTSRRPCRRAKSRSSSRSYLRWPHPTQAPGVVPGGES